MIIGKIGMVGRTSSGVALTTPPINNAEYVARWSFGDPSSNIDPVTGGVSFLADLTGNGHDLIQKVSQRQPRITQTNGWGRASRGFMDMPNTILAARTDVAHTYLAYGKPSPNWGWVGTLSPSQKRNFSKRSPYLFSDFDFFDIAFDEQVGLAGLSRVGVDAAAAHVPINIPSVISQNVLYVVERLSTTPSLTTVRAVTPDGIIHKFSTTFSKSSILNIEIDMLGWKRVFTTAPVTPDTDSTYEVAYRNTPMTDATVLNYFENVKAVYG